MKVGKKAVVLPVLATAGLSLGAAWAADSPAVGPVADAASRELAQAPVPTPFPEMGPTLSANPDPLNFDVGPAIGRVYVTGVVSGLGFWQSNPFPGNNDGSTDISNGMVFVQNASGPVQFMAQVGIYSIPALSEPYTRASDLNDLL